MVAFLLTDWYNVRVTRFFRDSNMYQAQAGLAEELFQND